MEQKLSKTDGALLLKLARQSIQNQLAGQQDKDESLESDLPENLKRQNRGTFVSLHKKGDLRGCIGNIGPVKTLAQGVLENARHAAFNDSRFQALSQQELDETIIEVSILTVPQEIEYSDYNDLISKLRPGVDGVMIKKAYQSATFLPQVWEQLTEPEQFLNHLCIKAGLAPEEWKAGDLCVSVYQVQSFEE